MIEIIISVNDEKDGRPLTDIQTNTLHCECLSFRTGELGQTDKQRDGWTLWMDQVHYLPASLKLKQSGQ